ncbi:MAG: Mur ligase family protein, partial [Rikenellaceae bacterium]
MCVDSHNNITTEQLYARFLKVDSIVTDSRLVLSEVAKGKKVMFFCLKGDSFDANDFIDEVLESGAAYIVSDREGVVGSEKILKTANTLTALQSMANHHRRGMRAQVIALTGSNGKTTTKELMNVVLSKKYNVLSTKGNLNNHIGVPLTLLSVTDK